MKRFAALMLVLAALFSLCACGKSETVKEVEKAIDQIGTVSINSKDKIETAERMYNFLTDKEKEKVENRLDLSNAREKYNQLVAQEKARQEAEEAEKNALTDMEKAAVKCCQYLKDACYNSDSFQIKEINGVLHYNQSNRYVFQVEISYMNSAGGYSKDLFYMSATPSKLYGEDGLGVDVYYHDWDKSIKVNEKVSLDKNRIADNLK